MTSSPVSGFCRLNDRGYRPYYLICNRATTWQCPSITGPKGKYWVVSIRPELFFLALFMIINSARKNNSGLIETTQHVGVHGHNGSVHYNIMKIFHYVIMNTVIMPMDTYMSAFMGIAQIMT